MAAKGKTFTNSDGNQIIFYMRPCAERQSIRPLINEHGGIITSNPVTANSIKLAEGGSIVSGNDYITSRYIIECVKQGKILDQEPFRIKPGSVAPRGPSDDADSISSGDDLSSDDDLSPADYVKKQQEVDLRLIKGRNKYTNEEDLAIISYLITHNLYRDANGLKIWRQLEDLKVTSHTAQSMHTRYRKNILPNIRKYDIQRSWISKLTGVIQPMENESFSVEDMFARRKSPRTNKDTNTILDIPSTSNETTDDSRTNKRYQQLEFVSSATGNNKEIGGKISKYFSSVNSKQADKTDQEVTIVDSSVRSKAKVPAVKPDKTKKTSTINDIQSELVASSSDDIPTMVNLNGCKNINTHDTQFITRRKRIEIFINELSESNRKKESVTTSNKNSETNSNKPSTCNGSKQSSSNSNKEPVTNSNKQSMTKGLADSVSNSNSVRVTRSSMDAQGTPSDSCDQNSLMEVIIDSASTGSSSPNMQSGNKITKDSGIDNVTLRVTRSTDHKGDNNNKNKTMGKTMAVGINKGTSDSTSQSVHKKTKDTTHEHESPKVKQHSVLTRRNGNVNSKPTTRSDKADGKTLSDEGDSPLADKRKRKKTADDTLTESNAELPKRTKKDDAKTNHKEQNQESVIKLQMQTKTGASKEKRNIGLKQKGRYFSLSKAEVTPILTETNSKKEGNAKNNNNTEVISIDSNSDSSDNAINEGSVREDDLADSDVDTEEFEDSQETMVHQDPDGRLYVGDPQQDLSRISDSILDQLKGPQLSSPSCPRTSTPNKKEGQRVTAADSSSDDSIEECRTLCRDIARKYDLHYSSVSSLLYACNGCPPRVLSYIEWGKLSDYPPPWTESDDDKLEDPNNTTSLATKYGLKEVADRIIFLDADGT